MPTKEKLKITYLNHSDIYADPDNPRKDFPEKMLNNLRDNILQNGLDTPLQVRYLPEKSSGRPYRIIAGERRWRAIDGFFDELPCIIRVATDEEAREISLNENLQRVDLTAEEEALIVYSYYEAGWSAAKIAAIRNFEPSWAYNRLDYMKVGEDVREVGRRTRKSMSALVWADKVKDGNKKNSLRKSLLKRIEFQKLSKVKVEAEVREYLDKKAIQDKADRLRAAQFKAPDAFTERARAQHERDESERRFRSLTDQTEPTPAPTSATLPNDGVIDDAREFAPFVSPIDVLGGGAVTTIEAPTIAIEAHIPESENLIPELSIGIPESNEAEQSRAEARAAKEEIAADARRALAVLRALTDLTDDDTYQEIADFSRDVLRGDLRR